MSNQCSVYLKLIKINNYTFFKKIIYNKEEIKFEEC